MVEHWDDVEADFLVFYRLRDPMALPLDQLVVMARRLFFYQGALQYRAMEAQEGQGQGQVQTHQRYTDPDQQEVDMRHNMVAAKAAAKGAGLKEGDDEVRVVPAATWVGLVPPGTVEHVEVKV